MRKGQKHSKISKQKQRDSHLGKKLTQAHRDKISETAKKRGVGKWLIGQKPSEYQKEVARKMWTGKNNPRWKGGKPQPYHDRKRNARGSHTDSEFKELKKKYENMCLCCKQFEPEIKLSEDHIIPLILGGSDFIDNIQPLCLECNSRKNSKVVDYRNQVNITLT